MLWGLRPDAIHSVRTPSIASGCFGIVSGRFKTPECFMAASGHFMKASGRFKTAGCCGAVPGRFGMASGCFKAPGCFMAASVCFMMASGRFNAAGAVGWHPDVSRHLVTLWQLDAFWTPPDAAGRLRTLPNAFYYDPQTMMLF